MGAVGHCLVCRAATSEDRGLPECRYSLDGDSGKPAYFVVYASGLALNVTFTRAYATHAGPGMAAALDYCMRGVGVPMALLVSPISNSLLPEIARLRSLCRLRQAFRLIDRTVALAALVAVAGCAFALLFRTPRWLFSSRGGVLPRTPRCWFRRCFWAWAEPGGWSLLEIMSRSLFALDRPWLPVIAAAIPVLFNVSLTLWLRPLRPELLGIGSSLGLLLGFVVLFAMAHGNRKVWMGEKSGVGGRDWGWGDCGSLRSPGGLARAGGPTDVLFQAGLGR